MPSLEPRPRISVADIPHYAAKYDVPYDAPVANLVATVKSQGFLTKDQLITVCRWKTPRSQPKVAKNDDTFVQAVTNCALRESDPGLKIHVLMVLEGLGMPSASVILHWFDRDPYPILDYRALWSLGYDDLPCYTLPEWLLFVQRFRHLLEQAKTHPRTLDRALWQFSKENQSAAD